MANVSLRLTTDNRENPKIRPAGGREKGGQMVLIPLILLHLYPPAPPANYTSAHRRLLESRKTSDRVVQLCLVSHVS